MSPDEIVAQLARVQPRIPHEVLRAAGECRAELTPRLLAALAEVVAQPSLLEGTHDIELPFYAMYLLAAWREPAAHPLLLGFLRLPGDQPVELSGDIVTQDMDKMLVQTCAGNPQGIVALAADPQVNPWARLVAVSALSLLVAWGQMPRETLLAHYRTLIAAAGPPANTDEPDVALAEIVCCALDLRLVELREELLVLFDRGWIDESIVGSREEIVDEFDHPKPLHGKAPIDDVAEAIRWWGCFEKPSRRPSAASAIPPMRPLADIPNAVDREDPKPYRSPPKVGRNEPCPCGSGKKYKKCCGA